MKKLITILFVFATISTLHAKPKFTLKKTDQDIFGTYVLYERLPDMFQYASVSVNYKSPDDLLMYGEQYNTALVYVAPFLTFTARQVKLFDDFTKNGNVLFLSSADFGEEIDDWLNIKTTPASYNMQSPQYIKDSVAIWNAQQKLHEKFAIGRAIYNSYITTTDSTYNYANYGTDPGNNKNFVVIKKGEGYVVLHTSPYMLTNFHLLHKKSKVYSELLFSMMPKQVSTVLWDEWIKDAGSQSGGPLDFIMRNAALRNAFWWGLAALILLILLSLKRRQRVIQMLPANNNTTVDMVRTISDLYFFSHKNKIMAKKKIAHWFEFLRTRHNIHQNQSVEAFWQAVRKRTDINEQDFKELEIMVTRYKLGDVNPGDSQLIELTKLLDTFYKA